MEGLRGGREFEIVRDGVWERWRDVRERLSVKHLSVSIPGKTPVLPWQCFRDRSDSAGSFLYSLSDGICVCVRVSLCVLCLEAVQQ